MKFRHLLLSLRNIIYENFHFLSRLYFRNGRCLNVRSICLEKGYLLKSGFDYITTASNCRTFYIEFR